MRSKEKKIAKQFGISDTLQALNEALLAIPDVVAVEYDLSGFYDDLHQVIVLVKHTSGNGDGREGIPASLPADEWFSRRKALLESVYEVASAHGLTRTEDRLEDYGTWFYMVFHADGRWEAKGEPRDD